jgi:hypothetical protein
MKDKDFIQSNLEKKEAFILQILLPCFKFSIVNFFLKCPHHIIYVLIVTFP